MGILTSAMMRLRDEIVSSRHSRLNFRSEVVRQAAQRRSQVSALCTAFAHDRAGAHRAWFGRMPAEREVAEGEKQRRLAELANANAGMERQPPATAEQEPQKHATAEPGLAPGKRLPSKGSKRH